MKNMFLPLKKSALLLGLAGVASMTSAHAATATTNYEVTTFAGYGTNGFVNGNTTNAEFSGPQGLAMDKKGSLYIAEQNNNAIRKITIKGVVSTFAGQASPGFSNAIGTNASFYSPLSVGVDARGNVYVADANNNAIRKITVTGVVSTLAGHGTTGFADGKGTNASFHSPYGLTADARGNVYVADFGNNAIRKITPKGVVTTLAGNGTRSFVNGKGTNATFSTPYGVGVDKKGNVYVADFGNNAIRKIDVKGNVTTLAGSGKPAFINGQGTNAAFIQPAGVNVDSKGNVLVADTYNHAIRKIDSKGNVTTIAGVGTPGYVDGPATNAAFTYPTEVIANAKGHLFVADYFNNVIREITPVVSPKAIQRIAALKINPVTYHKDLVVGIGTTSSSGLPVSYSTTSTNIVLDGNTATVLGEGTATITVSQPGNDDYDAAPDITSTLVINPAH